MDLALRSAPTAFGAHMRNTACAAGAGVVTKIVE